MDKHEVHTLLTRAGQATKIVCTGDSGQVDNRTLTPNEDDGMTVLLSRMAGWERFGSVSLVNSYRSELAAEAALRFAD